MSIVAIDIHPQQAFSELCPEELPIKDALSIVPHLNRQAEWADYRVLTKDAHIPHAAWNIQKQHELLPLENAEHWVSHAVVGSRGFQTLPQLPEPNNYHYLVHIGLEQHTHAYGACFHDMAENISTGLIEWLNSRRASTLVLGGLATEYCVQATALQLRWYGDWDVIVNLEACRGMSTREETRAIENMKKGGVLIVRHTEEIPRLLAKYQPKAAAAEFPNLLNFQTV